MQQVFITLPVHLQGLSLAPTAGRNKRMVFSFLCTQQREGTFACHLIQSMQSEPWVGSYWVLCPMEYWVLKGPGPTGPRAGTKVGVGKFSKPLTSRNPILV